MVVVGGGGGGGGGAHPRFVATCRAWRTFYALYVAGKAASKIAGPPWYTGVCHTMTLAGMYFLADKLPKGTKIYSLTMKIGDDGHHFNMVCLDTFTATFGDDGALTSSKVSPLSVIITETTGCVRLSALIDCHPGPLVPHRNQPAGVPPCLLPASLPRCLSENKLAHFLCMNYYYSFFLILLTDNVCRPGLSCQADLASNCFVADYWLSTSHGTDSYAAQPITTTDNTGTWKIFKVGAARNKVPLQLTVPEAIPNLDD